jgi:deazaflavin-dependent oxidoreductase (nitroreductase family)
VTRSQDRRKDTVGRLVNMIHRTIFRTTGGRLGGKGFGMPVVELTTTGRKSGKPRPTMLTSPVQDGDTVVIVASWGGDDRHPQWYLNLLENPAVELTMGGRTRPMNARTASSEERAALWPRVVEAYRGYGQYQTRTDREIPLVLLEPAPRT